MLSRLSFFKKKPAEYEADSHKYCPSCGDEYRSDIERCTACNIDLITSEQKRIMAQAGGGKKAERSLVISPDDELVVITKGTLMEMKTLQRLLEKEVIGSLLVGDGPDFGKHCCGSSTFNLKVKAAEISDATAVLVQDFRRSTALESHDFGDAAEPAFDQRAVTTICPACGSRFVPQERTCPECGLCF